MCCTYCTQSRDRYPRTLPGQSGSDGPIHRNQLHRHHYWLSLRLRSPKGGCSGLF